MKPLLLISDRILQLSTAAINAAPANNVEPHIIQSPTIEGLPTKGFGLCLISPDGGGAAVPVASGFSLTIYRLIPTLGVWAAGMIKVGLAFNTQLLNYDMGGAQGWYFVIDPATVATDGIVLFAFVELP